MGSTELLRDLQEHYYHESAPPIYSDYDSFEFVGEETLSEARWGTWKQWVFKAADAEVYAAVKDVQPATEMQDWGDYGAPEIYLVEPVEVKTVTWRKVMEE